MRISDWSSDVCSSDLNKIAETFSIGKGLKEDAPDDAGSAAPSPASQKPGILKMAGLALCLVGAAAVLYLGVVSPGTLKQDGPKIANGGTAGGNSSQLQSKLGEIREVQLPDGSREIGRAAGGERVCQYV